MKESPRSKLLQYLNGSDGDSTALTNLYFAGLWETYFFYFPAAYTIAKETIDKPNYRPGANSCWERYFGKNV